MIGLMRRGSWCGVADVVGGRLLRLSFCPITALLAKNNPRNTKVCLRLFFAPALFLNKNPNLQRRPSKEMSL